MTNFFISYLYMLIFASIYVFADICCKYMNFFARRCPGMGLFLDNICIYSVLDGELRFLCTINLFWCMKTMWKSDESFGVSIWTPTSWLLTSIRWHILQGWLRLFSDRLTTNLSLMPWWFRCLYQSGVDRAHHPKIFLKNLYWNCYCLGTHTKAEPKLATGQ